MWALEQQQRTCPADMPPKWLFLSASVPVDSGTPVTSSPGAHTY